MTNDEETERIRKEMIECKQCYAVVFAMVEAAMEIMERHHEKKDA